MKCEDAQELFSAYVEGTADSAISVGLENHAASCSACRADLAGLRELWPMLEAMPVVEPPAYLHNSVMCRVQAEMQQQAVPTTATRAAWNLGMLFRPKVVALAATLVVLAFAGFEATRTQNAEIGPLGWVSSLFEHSGPAPLRLKVATAFWTPASSGGTLIVRLRPVAGEEGRLNGVIYSISMQGAQPVLASGIATSNRDSIVSITMDEAPIGIRPAIAVRLTASGASSHSRLVTIPIGMPTAGDGAGL